MFDQTTNRAMGVCLDSSQQGCLTNNNEGDEFKPYDVQSPRNSQILNRFEIDESDNSQMVQQMYSDGYLPHSYYSNASMIDPNLQSVLRGMNGENNAMHSSQINLHNDLIRKMRRAGSNGGTNDALISHHDLSSASNSIVSGNPDIATGTDLLMRSGDDLHVGEKDYRYKLKDISEIIEGGDDIHNSSASSLGGKSPRLYPLMNMVYDGNPHAFRVPTDNRSQGPYTDFSEEIQSVSTSDVYSPYAYVNPGDKIFNNSSPIQNIVSDLSVDNINENQTKGRKRKRRLNTRDPDEGYRKKVIPQRASGFSMGKPYTDDMMCLPLVPSQRIQEPPVYNQNQNPVEMASMNYCTPSPQLQAVVDGMKVFLATAPLNWSRGQKLKRYYITRSDSISCILWNNRFYITGADIVKSLVYRFSAFGRPIRNMKKFEEGVFSDLRNLKPGSESTLESSHSEFLKYLYSGCCVKTQKKQKVFYWSSVPHDRLFMDALKRDFRREALGIEPTTVPLMNLSMSRTLELAKKECLVYLTNNESQINTVLEKGKPQNFQLKEGGQQYFNSSPEVQMPAKNIEQQVPETNLRNKDEAG